MSFWPPKRYVSWIVITLHTVLLRLPTRFRNACSHPSCIFHVVSWWYPETGYHWGNRAAPPATLVGLPRTENFTRLPVHHAPCLDCYRVNGELLLPLRIKKHAFLVSSAMVGWYKGHHLMFSGSTRRERCNVCCFCIGHPQTCEERNMSPTSSWGSEPVLARYDPFS